MTGIELAELAKKVVNIKTGYAKGAFGAPCNQKNAIRYNQDKVEEDRFLFDCCGLWHALCAGWNGDTSHVYGGTQVHKAGNGIAYGPLNIPDNGADGAFKNFLVGVSSDMTTVQPGEIEWIPGHNGIYIGGGFSIESTPKWGGGVQISQSKDPKAPRYREWLQHGKVPGIEYADTDSVKIDTESSYPLKSIKCPCCGAEFVLNG